MIGIDKERNLLYEGTAGRGWQVGYAHTVYPARLVLNTDDEIKGANTKHMLVGEYVFRELESDPAAGLRRGIFFVGNDKSQPSNWSIIEHDKSYALGNQCAYSVSVLEFGECKLSHKIKNAERNQPLVCIGSEENFSVGTLQSIEVNAAGDEVLTLKMRKQFGLLPDLIEERFENEDLGVVNRKLRLVRESYAVMLPDAIVDRCRDAVSAAIGIKVNNRKLDLGNGIKKLKGLEPVPNVAVSAAEIIRLFHSRPKPSIQAQYGKLPELTEQDAELAIRLLGSVICELEYAKW